jgi:phosphohistidine phosphatase SixA
MRGSALCNGLGNNVPLALEFPAEATLKPIRNFLTSCSVCIIFLAVVMIPQGTFAAEAESVIFLARHAEKTDESHDPQLSGTGRQRASELAQLLRNAGIEHIHSTDFNRTKDTAAPLAELLGLGVELYDWNESEVFAHSLKQSGQRHLVIGHSNTTTELVTLLGGEAGTAIDDSGEYDRLYILTIDGKGRVSGVLLRYGDVFR